MSSFLDTRNGIGYSKSINIEYESLKNIGKSADGLDLFIYFDKIPWISVKTTYEYIADESFWNNAIEKMKTDYLALLKNQSGIYTESVNVGSKLVLNNEVHYDGSITETDYRSSIGTFPSTYNLFEYSSGNYSVAGHWDDNGRSGLHRKAYFNSLYYGKIAYRNYTSTSAKETIGESTTIAGVSGIVSSINSSNERYINGVIVKDFSIQLSATTGTPI